MKILILSDSHGQRYRMTDIIARHKDASAIVFLGDGERDFELALAENYIDICGNESLEILQVCGNCDLMSNEPAVIIHEFAGTRFLITHGFAQHVKRDLDRLEEEMSAKQCRVALFGHTHMSCLKQSGNLFMFNPGAVVNGSYGIITIGNDCRISPESFTWERV